MADEPQNEAPEDETSAPAPADEGTADAPADVAATPDEETSTESATAEEPAAAPAAAEPEQPVTPKERKRRARTAKAAAVPARPSRTPEERQAERVAERRRKAAIRSARRRQEREKARGRRTAAPEPLTPLREQHPGQQKTRQGVVVSDRASKTIVVRIDVTRRHPFYEKIVRTSRTLRAHDEREDAHIGDTVVVRECRPLSRTKRWRLVEVVERAK
jgi:small subunit ribosomal protein S17